jgi:hypothetical protein
MTADMFGEKCDVLCVCVCVCVCVFVRACMRACACQCVDVIVYPTIIKQKAKYMYNAHDAAGVNLQ